MGNDKRKRTKQAPESDISDFDENSQPPTTSTNDTKLNKHQNLIFQILMKTVNLQLPQQTIHLNNFPRFILVESKEEGRQRTSLSPFLDTKSHTEYSW